MKLKTLKESFDELNVKLNNPSIGLDKAVLNTFVETMLGNNSDSKEQIRVMNLLDDEVNRLSENGVGKEICANVYHLVALHLQRESIWFSLLEKAYRLYKMTDNRIDTISCGLNLVIHYDRDMDNPQKTISLLLDCLAMAEEEEGCKGELYYSVLCDNNLHVLSRLHKDGYQKYIKDFLIDYSPSNLKQACKLFHDLSNSCNKMLNKQAVAVDDVFFPNYIKYKKQEIECRKKALASNDSTEAEKDKAVYELMVFYSCAYDNTRDEKYLESAKKLFKDITASKYKSFAIDLLHQYQMKN